MTADEKEELLDLLAWAFNEAEVWLYGDRGAYHVDDEAERIREILRDNDKYVSPFDN